MSNIRLTLIIVLFFHLILPMDSFALTLSEPALDADFNTVVVIKTEDVDENGEDVPAYCVGTLLSKNVIITAAHCVLGNHVLQRNQIEVQIGKYKNKTMPDGTVRRIGYVHFYHETLPARYFFTNTLNAQIQRSGLKTKIGPTDDIAIALLQTEIQTEEPLNFAKVIPQNYLNGAVANLVNYWPTSVTVNLFTEMSLDTKRWAKLNNIKKSSGYFESVSNSRIEEGDSGSPFYLRIGTSWYLAGIAKGRATTFFSNWDVFGILDQKVCEISKNNEVQLKSLLCP